MNGNELKAFCRENGIKGYSAKKKEDIIKLIQESTIDTETVEEKKESLVLKSDVYWYKIPEISIETYLHNIKELYNIAEDKKKSKSEPDPFAQEGWIAYHEDTSDKWEEEIRRDQKKRAWTMAIGDFHQNLMGSFPGWENYKKGHKTRCDIGKNDNSCVAEIKNNVNTMNSSSKESVIKKLKVQKDLGKRALLIIVNGDIKKEVKDEIEYISGREFYKELSGRSTFMDDLLSTYTECFRLYKTYESLKAALESA